MEELKTYLECGRCNGTGVAHTTSEQEDITEDPCSRCGGAGFFVSGKVDGAEQLKDILKDTKDILKDTKDILKALEK